MMAAVSRGPEINASEPSDVMTVGNLKNSASVGGKRMHARVTPMAWAGTFGLLALVLCVNAAPAACSELPIAGKSMLREANSRRNCSSFRDSAAETRAENINVRDLWIYKALGGGHSYDPSTNPEFEFSGALVLGSLIGMFGSIMGSVGGIGGGGFYLPMLNVVMGFDSTISIALSKAMVMGAAISAVIFNLKIKHPNEARAVINYQFAVLFQPMILLGISVGVILNVLLPDWLVTFFLVMLFIKLFKSAYRKAKELSAKETQLRQDNARNAAITHARQDGAENGDYVEIPQNDPGYASQEKVTWQWFPKRPLAILFVTWLMFLALQIFKTHVADCSSLYWVATILQVPVAFGVTIWEAFRSAFAEEEGTEENEKFPTIKSDAGHKKGIKNMLLSFLGLVAGIAGGLLGIGGGGILGPGFLEFGLCPQESSITASFIMCFSSSLSVVEYFYLGQLPTNFAIYFVLLSMITSIFGQVVIKRIVDRSGRTSIIVYILSGCIMAGNITLGIMGVIRSWEQWEAGENMGIQDYCASL